MTGIQWSRENGLVLYTPFRAENAHSHAAPVALLYSGPVFVVDTARTHYSNRPIGLLAELGGVPNYDGRVP